MPGGVLIPPLRLQELVQSPGYFGVIAGRFANRFLVLWPKHPLGLHRNNTSFLCRIKHGSFKLDGESYSLAVNNGENHLHGGWAGLDKRVWSLDRSPEVLADGPDGPCAQLTLRLVSADGDEGYPGELQVN